jgi:hypothetical protein
MPFVNTAITATDALRNLSNGAEQLTFTNLGGFMATPEEMATSAPSKYCTPITYPNKYIDLINHVTVMLKQEPGNANSIISQRTAFSSPFTADDLKYVSSEAIMVSLVMDQGMGMACMGNTNLFDSIAQLYHYIAHNYYMMSCYAALGAYLQHDGAVDFGAKAKDQPSYRNKFRVINFHKVLKANFEQQGLEIIGDQTIAGAEGFATPTSDFSATGDAVLAVESIAVGASDALGTNLTAKSYGVKNYVEISKHLGINGYAQDSQNFPLGLMSDKIYQVTPLSIRQIPGAETEVPPVWYDSIGPARGGWGPVYSIVPVNSDYHRNILNRDIMALPDGQRDPKFKDRHGLNATKNKFLTPFKISDGLNGEARGSHVAIQAWGGFIHRTGARPTEAGPLYDDSASFNDFCDEEPVIPFAWKGWGYPMGHIADMGALGNVPSMSIAGRYAQLYYDTKFLIARMGKCLEAVKPLAELANTDAELAASQAELIARRKALEAEAEKGLTEEKAAELEALTEQLENTAALAKTAELFQSNTAEFASQFRTREQCYLLKNIRPLAAAHIQKMSRNTSGAGASVPQPNDLAVYNTSPEGPKGHVIQGSPGSVVTGLTYDPAYAAYYLLTPAKLSYLVPSVKLYQVLHQHFSRNQAGEKVASNLGVPVDFEVPFFQHITQQAIEDIMSGNYGSKGGQVGLDSFTWVYQGSNPANSRRDIKATLTLHAQSFDDLLNMHSVTLSKEDGTTFTHEWNYVDLAIRRNRNHQIAPDVLYSQLKVVAGWSLPDAPHEDIGFTDDEIRAIKNSRTTMYLTIIDHSFDILEDGAVNFKIEYRAYIEGAFTSPEANILVTQESLNRELAANQARAKMAANIQDPNGECTDEDMAELRRRITNSIQLDKADAHVSLIKGLEEHPDGSKIYLHEVTVAEMLQFLSAPSFAGTDQFRLADRDTTAPIGTGQTGIAARLESAINFPTEVDFNSSENNVDVDSMLKTAFAPIQGQKIYLPYFFLGDLVHVALQNIDKGDGMKGKLPEDADPNNTQGEPEPRKFTNMRILLGPVELVNPADPSDIMQVNLADIPISMNYFLEWFLERITAKNTTKWYIVEFIKDLTRNLVFKTLGSEDCFNGAFRQRSTFQNLYLTGKGSDGVDPISMMMGTKFGDANSPSFKTRRFFMDEFLPDEANLPMLAHDTEDEEAPSRNMFHYVLMYAADPTPRNLRGEYEDDVKKGVFHFHIGTNRGTVKRIKFEKTDQPYLREARFFGQGYGGLSQLREPYKITIDMYGNSKVFPGQTIFVDPSGLGYKLGKPNIEGTDAHLLGLGGYHMIINVDHEISRGVYATTAKATWVMRGSPDGEATAGAPAVELVRESAQCQAFPSSGVLSEDSGYEPPDSATTATAAADEGSE